MISRISVVFGNFFIEAAVFAASIFWQLQQGKRKEGNYCVLARFAAGPRSASFLIFRPVGRGVGFASTFG